MKPALRTGLPLPVAVLAAAVVVGVLADAWAGFVALAIGAGAILVFHLRNVQRLADWSAAPLDAPVPEGSGPWKAAFAALYQRVRLRTTYQRELAQTIERFRSAAEAIPDGMVVIDIASRIRWANTAALTQFGLDPAGDQGQPLANLVRQPDFIRYLDGGDFSESILVDSQRTPGVTLQIQIVPFGVDERLVISRDVTRLEAVSRMRRDFIANISHELKTPLTVVSGFIETLQDLELEPRQRIRFLQLMHEQSKSMQRLVDDLLTLSALESEQNALQEAVFPAAPLLLERAADARALSAGQHVIELDLGDAATVSLGGNREELASAFGNLVSNAIRYTPAGGTIRLGWRTAADGRGIFSVTDSGIGIAPEHIPRLTERFYRVDRSRSRATGGTGLGLAIVKHVLLRHQAELDVVSEPGQGSTFSVVLPARRVTRGLEGLPAPTGGLPDTAEPQVREPGA
ncbi:MAG: phosphate regulon sensor histidine kinase PhoR [Betaproteobacteria bacterium]|nr:phosphate regulon sensor histidine kinase PhoR [Betaproteobacteria bacterium]